MNFRDFLQSGSESLRLPYFGGRKLCDREHQYRIREELAPGWYRFSRQGRNLQAEEPIAPEPENWKLRSALGYLVGRHLVDDEQRRPLLGLLADEAPPRFSPVRAFVWFDGNLLFGEYEFEDEAETQVREAYEDERGIDGIKGVRPALAHAFLLEATTRELAREAERRREQEAALRQEMKRARTLEGRIALALSHTGAQLIDWRQLRRDEAVIRYRVSNRRFECVINTKSLQIIDAGICLSGADEELSLSSLPSAVREAIDTGALHVMRHI